jgi:hypothetical protein
MALPVAGEIDALAALHCKRGNPVHLSSSGCPQRQRVIFPRLRQLDHMRRRRMTAFAA